MVAYGPVMPGAEDTACFYCSTVCWRIKSAASSSACRPSGIGAIGQTCTISRYSRIAILPTLVESRFASESRISRVPEGLRLLLLLWIRGQRACVFHHIHSLIAAPKSKS